MSYFTEKIESEYYEIDWGDDIYDNSRSLPIPITHKGKGSLIYFYCRGRKNGSVLPPRFTKRVQEIFSDHLFDISTKYVDAAAKYTGDNGEFVEMVEWISNTSIRYILRSHHVLIERAMRITVHGFTGMYHEFHVLMTRTK